MADANSTQYAKFVSTSIQDLVKPVERGGRLRTAQFTHTNPGSSPPSSSEFAYLTKLPPGAVICGIAPVSEAGLQASGTAVVEVKTGGTESSPSCTSISGALDVATGGQHGFDGTGVGVVVTGKGRVRLNPGVNTVASKYFKGTIFYCVD